MITINQTYSRLCNETKPLPDVSLANSIKATRDYSGIVDEVVILPPNTYVRYIDQAIETDWKPQTNLDITRNTNSKIKFPEVLERR